MEANQQLSDLLLYAKNNIGYYSDIIPSSILKTNSNIDVIDIFRTLSIIDKNIIKRDLRNFVNIDIIKNCYDEISDMDKDYKREYTYDVENGQVVVEYSSGTTGIPFLSIKSLDERFKLGNSLWKLRSSFYPVNVDTFFNFIHNFGDSQYPFPFPIESKDTETEKLTKELEYLSSSIHSWWHINTYRLNLYCNIILNHDFKFENLRVIENNGSFISDTESIEYEKIFNCKVVNNYGCREVWTIAYGCRFGYLHVNNNGVYLELVDDNDNIIEKPNIVGNVVITSIKQRVMPFIRYKIGDQAYYVDGECLCGKQSRRICLLPGRHLIKGTHIYGNIHFRSVVRSVLSCNITKFESINVIQTNIEEFTIFVRGCENNREVLEKLFIRFSNDLLQSYNYQYIFKYNNNMQPKAIFTVNIQRES